MIARGLHGTPLAYAFNMNPRKLPNLKVMLVDEDTDRAGKVDFEYDPRVFYGRMV